MKPKKIKMRKPHEMPEQEEAKARGKKNYVQYLAQTTAYESMFEGGHSELTNSVGPLCQANYKLIFAAQTDTTRRSRGSWHLQQSVSLADLRLQLLLCLTPFCRVKPCLNAVKREEGGLCRRRDETHTPLPRNP
jgi:hypothetical protein